MIYHTEKSSGKWKRSLDGLRPESLLMPLQESLLIPKPREMQGKLKTCKQTNKQAITNKSSNGNKTIESNIERDILVTQVKFQQHSIFILLTQSMH